MSDFGEYLPFDAILKSGVSAAAMHNEFPGLWARTCREAQQEAGRDGDVVFWSRSASVSRRVTCPWRPSELASASATRLVYARSPAWSTAFWAGDQTTTWDSYDGLASALRGMLSGGLSGLAISHTDLGGYTMLVVPNETMVVRSRELLQRWMEMSVFSDSIFRSHVGNLPELSAQVSDALIGVAPVVCTTSFSL
jgi:sulfoquinovosidase